MVRPTKLPNWADTAGVGDIVEPTEVKKSAGWEKVGGIPEKPPYQYFNYWQNSVYNWVNYLDAAVTALATQDLTLRLDTPTLGQTLAIGDVNAAIINIGKTGSAVNILGTLKSSSILLTCALAGITTVARANSANANAVTIPDFVTNTLASVNNGQTFTGSQAFNSNIVLINTKNTSLAGSATSTDKTITFPNVTSTLAALDIAQTFSLVNTFSAVPIFSLGIQVTSSGGTSGAAKITRNGTSWEFGGTTSTITEAGAFAGATGVFNTSVTSALLTSTGTQTVTAGTNQILNAGTTFALNVGVNTTSVNAFSSTALGAVTVGPAATTSQHIFQGGDNPSVYIKTAAYSGTQTAAIAFGITTTPRFWLGYDAAGNELSFRYDATSTTLPTTKYATVSSTALWAFGVSGTTTGSVITMHGGANSALSIKGATSVSQIGRDVNSLYIIQNGSDYAGTNYAEAKFANRIQISGSAGAGGVNFDTAPKGANIGDAITWTTVGSYNQVGSFIIGPSAYTGIHTVNGSIFMSATGGAASFPITVGYPYIGNKMSHVFLGTNGDSYLAAGMYYDGGWKNAILNNSGCFIQITNGSGSGSSGLLNITSQQNFASPAGTIITPVSIMTCNHYGAFMIGPSTGSSLNHVARSGDVTVFSIQAGGTSKYVSLTLQATNAASAYVDSYTDFNFRVNRAVTNYDAGYISATGNWSHGVPMVSNVNTHRFIGKKTTDYSQTSHMFELTCETGGSSGESSLRFGLDNSNGRAWINSLDLSGAAHALHLLSGGSFAGGYDNALAWTFATSIGVGTSATIGTTISAAAGNFTLNYDANSNYIQRNVYLTTGNRIEAKGAARIWQAADGSNATLTLQTAVTGIANSAITWVDNIVCADSGKVTIGAGTQAHRLNTATGAGSGTASFGTSNAPIGGNPAGWIQIQVNSATSRYIPFW